MLTSRVEEPAQIHQFCPVELQGVNCDAPSGRQANDAFETFIPCEVCLPTLLARMKQRHKLTCQEISCPRLVVFVVVTSLAGEGEVRERRVAALTAGNDMVKRKRLGGIFGRTLTILTASLGMPFYFATQC